MLIFWETFTAACKKECVNIIDGALPTAHLNLNTENTTSIVAPPEFTNRAINILCFCIKLDGALT